MIGSVCVSVVHDDVSDYEDVYSVALKTPKHVILICSSENTMIMIHVFGVSHFQTRILFFHYLHLHRSILKNVRTAQAAYFVQQYQEALLRHLRSRAGF